MRILFIASGEFAQPTLRWLAQSGHEVPLVVTQPSREAGRGRRQTRTPASQTAAELGLEVLETENINEPGIVARIRALNARFGLVIAFGQKLGPELLASMPGGCINLHASLLPKYRGAAPINWAIVRGEEKTGCTVFRIVQRMDAGPVLTSRWTFIKPDESADELHDRLAAIGVDAVQAAIALFEGDALPQGSPQKDAEATLAPKLKKADGVIEFGRSARDVINHIHGMTTWPGASTRYQSQDGRWEQLQLCRVRVAEDPAKPTIPPGTIDARRYAAAKDRFIEILELKPSSHRLMTWQEYVNGRHVKAGDSFAPP